MEANSWSRHFFSPILSNTNESICSSAVTGLGNQISLHIRPVGEWRSAPNTDANILSASLPAGLAYGTNLCDRLAIAGGKSIKSTRTTNKLIYDSHEWGLVDLERSVFSLDHIIEPLHWLNAALAAGSQQSKLGNFCQALILTWNFRVGFASGSWYKMHRDPSHGLCSFVLIRIRNEFVVMCLSITKDLPNLEYVPILVLMFVGPYISSCMNRGPVP